LLLFLMRDRVQAVKPFKRNPNGEVTDEGRVVLSTKSMYSACPIIWTYFNDFVAKKFPSPSQLSRQQGQTLKWRL